MFSVVIPVYNEETNLPALNQALEGVFEKLGQPYEIVYVDDGSRDQSFDVLKQLALQNPQVRAVRLRKNFGQSAAMRAGIDTARGEIIITLDADLQNDPADIPAMIEHMSRTQCDIVSGWRKDRKDHFLSRTFVSRIANGLISEITKVRLHDYGCTLKIYRAEVIKSVNLYGELHRFLTALASWQGAKIEEVVVNHRPRHSGKSKYGLSRIYRVLFDLLAVKYFLTYNAKPLHFFGSIGFFIMLPGLLLAAWISLTRFLFHADISPRIPTLIFCALSILAGFQMIMMGLLADLIVRSSKENAHENPTYRVREMIGSEEPVRK